MITSSIYQLWLVTALSIDKEKERNAYSGANEILFTSLPPYL